MSDIKETIYYRELRAGEIIQKGDEWWPKDGTGQWQAYHQGMFGLQVLDASVARRPHNITALQKERDEARAEMERLSTALKSAQRARDELQLQVDELRAGLMGVVSAERVHSMLEDMLDQTEWVGQCLDSTTYEQMSCIQRTISVIAERVRDMVREGTSANT